jgi:hypothetical protein
VVLFVAGALLWNERQSRSATADDDGPVEVVVDDD